jgi:uncharacterized membrane protein YtjA (UPF0391 family)
MSPYPVLILAVALVAGVFSFSAIAGASTGIARIIFLVFVVLFFVSLLLRKRRGF